MATHYPLLGYSIALCIACGGCGSPWDGVIDITYNPFAPTAVTPGSGTRMHEQQSLADAIEIWSAACDETQLTTEHDDEPTQNITVSFEQASDAFFGIYRDDTGDIVINRALGDAHVRAVTVAHELGHAFGLLHVERKSRRSIMNPNNTTVLPTPRDVEALRAHWADRTCGPCRAEP